MKLCQEQGLYQVDLNQYQKRVTNEEYRVKQRGQEALDRQNEALVQDGQTPKQTKFETEKEKIRQAILAAVSASQSLENLQRILREEHGI